MNRKHAAAGDIFRQAVRFLAASELLEKAILDNLERQNTSYGQLVIVLAVNLSFACELFLKACIAIQKPNSDTIEHGLQTLFTCLVPNTQSEIMNDVSNRLAPRTHNFLEDLEASNRVFVAWRYLHEEPVGKEVRLDFLKHFASAMERRLEAALPDWQLSFRKRANLNSRG